MELAPEQFIYIVYPECIAACDVRNMATSLSKTCQRLLSYSVNLVKAELKSCSELLRVDVLDVLLHVRRVQVLWDFSASVPEPSGMILFLLSHSEQEKSVVEARVKNATTKLREACGSVTARGFWTNWCFPVPRSRNWFWTTVAPARGRSRESRRSSPTWSCSASSTSG